MTDLELKRQALVVVEQLQTHCDDMLLDENTREWLDRHIAELHRTLTKELRDVESELLMQFVRNRLDLTPA